MDCMKALKQIVVPIFYDVNPSDLRKQTGVVEEAFAKHEQHFGGGSDGTVEKWKAALTEAANLPGFVLQNMANGNEAELIKMIIEEVRQRVDQTHVNVADHQVGVDQLRLTQGYEGRSQISRSRPAIHRWPSRLIRQERKWSLCPVCKAGLRAKPKKSRL